MPTMMAMRITKETYPIAVACLGISYRDYSLSEEDAYGYYLVINKEGAPDIVNNAAPRYSNVLLPSFVFNNTYEFRPTEFVGQFTTIRELPKISNPTYNPTYSKGIPRPMVEKIAHELCPGDEIEICGVHARIDEIHDVGRSKLGFDLRLGFVNDYVKDRNQANLVLPKNQHVKILGK